MIKYISEISCFLKKTTLLVCLIVALFVLLILIFGASSSISLQGGCDQVASPFLQYYPKGNYRITYCKNGDADLDKIKTDYFLARNRLQFEYAGYPEKEEIDIFIENHNGSRFDIPLINAAENWKKINITIPPELRDGLIRLVVRDASSNHKSWIGIGELKSFNFFFYINDIVVLIFAIVCVHIILIMCFSFIERRFDDLEIAVSCFFVVIGTVGYLAFWVYYVSHLLGIIFSIIPLSLTIYELLQAAIRQKWHSIAISNRIILPATFYAFFILSIGYYPFNDIGSTFAISANRWLSLPIDNWIPKIFADQVWNGAISVPMLGDWLSSDRPPLQTGINLLFYPICQSGLIYQVVSSILQSLIFLPVFILVRRIEFRAAKFIIIGISMTSLMAVHTLFVWPKLFSAAYVFVFYLLLTSFYEFNYSKITWYILTGMSAALAMLSHGGAIFALTAIALIFVFRYPSEAIRKGSLAMFFSFFLYIPWIIYQRVIDPPGDRLVKWHLAGMIEPNNLSVFQSIVKAYQKITIESWIEGRIANIEVIFSHTFDFIYDFFISICSIPQIISNVERTPAVISRSFFETFYSFWWINPVIAITVWILCRGWRKLNHYEIFWLGAAGILTLFVWAFLMFIPSSTVIHQGCFFSWVAIFICSSLLLWQASQLIFSIFNILNGVIFVLFYVLDVFGRDGFVDATIYFIIVTMSFLFFVSSCMSLEFKNRKI